MRSLLVLAIAVGCSGCSGCLGDQPAEETAPTPATIPDPGVPGRAPRQMAPALNVHRMFLDMDAIAAARAAADEEAAAPPADSAGPSAPAPAPSGSAAAPPPSSSAAAPAPIGRARRF